MKRPVHIKPVPVISTGGKKNNKIAVPNTRMQLTVQLAEKNHAASLASLAS
jgi:hypothetical protein